MHIAKHKYLDANGYMNLKDSHRPIDTGLKIDVFSCIRSVEVLEHLLSHHALSVFNESFFFFGSSKKLVLRVDFPLLSNLPENKLVLILLSSQVAIFECCKFSNGLSFVNMSRTKYI